MAGLGEVLHFTRQDLFSVFRPAFGPQETAGITVAPTLNSKFIPELLWVANGQKQVEVRKSCPRGHAITGKTRNSELAVGRDRPETQVFKVCNTCEDRGPSLADCLPSASLSGKVK